jgi:hypothetical protein
VMGLRKTPLKSTDKNGVKSAHAANSNPREGGKRATDRVLDSLSPIDACSDGTAHSHRLTSSEPRTCVPACRSNPIQSVDCICCVSKFEKKSINQVGHVYVRTAGLRSHSCSHDRPRVKRERDNRYRIPPQTQLIMLSCLPSR